MAREGAVGRTVRMKARPPDLLSERQIRRHARWYIRDRNIHGDKRFGSLTRERLRASIGDLLLDMGDRKFFNVREQCIYVERWLRSETDEIGEELIESERRVLRWVREDRGGGES